MISLPYTRSQVRKAIVAVIGAVVALVGHYDPGFADDLGDTLTVIATVLTPLFVYAVPNDA